MLVTGGSGASLAVFADDDGNPAETPLESLAPDGLMTPFGASSSFLTDQSALHPLLLPGETYWIGMNAPEDGLAVWNQTTSQAAASQ